MGSELEISRMKEKCKSYEHEVVRLKHMHEEETLKLKIRIKNLEKLIRRSDYLITFYHKEFFHLSSSLTKSLKVLKDGQFCLISKNEYPNELQTIKKMLCEEEMVEFVKTRRIFKDTIDQISKIESFDLEETNIDLKAIFELMSAQKNTIESQKNLIFEGGTSHTLEHITSVVTNVISSESVIEHVNNELETSEFIVSGS